VPDFTVTLAEEQALILSHPSPQTDQHWQPPAGIVLREQFDSDSNQQFGNLDFSQHFARDSLLVD
jgi:hypothetical protein